MKTATLDELVASDSVYVRWAVNPLQHLATWQLASGWASLVDGDEGPVLLTEGELNLLDYARLIAAAVELGQSPVFVNLPTTLAEKIAIERPHRWVWLWRETPLRSLPQGCEVVEPGAVDGELAKFLEAAAPDSSRKPGHPEVEFWVVHRNPAGDIDGCAGGSRWSTGLANIVSVAVATAARGRGIGSAVTQVAASEWFSRGESRVALGVRQSNAAALHVYRRLGFDHEIDYTSFRLADSK